MDLQELIARGRFIFASAPERLRTYELVNGRRNTHQIAAITKRHANAIRRDLRILLDAEMIQGRMDRHGSPLISDGFPVYEKVPLARTVSSSYFKGPAIRPEVRGPKRASAQPSPSPKGREPKPLPVPNENELLDICRSGEDQLHEFKGQGTEPRKITREIAAMLNTRQGGLVFYGIDDDGTIQGSDVKRQKLDQSVQNSLKNTVSPAATIRFHSIAVMGYEIVAIVVPPWNRRRRDIYQYEGRVLLRKGTNVFTATPDESKRLHRGEYVV